MGILRIISRSPEPFTDREEAGLLLGKELTAYSGRNTVVLGIPRGGVVVAWRAACILGSEMDVVLSRKLGAPGNPEFAIGAISEDGKLFLGEAIRERMGDYQDLLGYVEREREKQYAEIAKRIARYRDVRPKVPLKGKVVIVTDDGIATGATMQASLWSARREEPEKLIAAAPVASLDAMERIADDADEAIALKVPPYFQAVGQFYTSFGQTTDEEVISILRESVERGTCG
ncbi:MAG TPA: phosphoribosyltransferase family protein [Deltaproteobacteria bacterium]|jgi:predicted phosphoribosyltransferase|nr:phosphoribosyltransferase family protein [Deltaproteobacteria bacterium]HQJ07887.1 phosphoribosyltransferase family protein [Deltaproteobacteria bacterium]